MLETYYAKTESGILARPFRCEGYVRDGTIPKGNHEDVLMDKLPPFLRTLVVTDGTVTKSLEAYYWEPIRVDTVDQELTTAASSLEWLHIEKGEEILTRQVRLVGENSGKIYACAFSVIRPDHIPGDLRQRLIDREIGIGVLIRDSGLETYREVLEVGVDQGMASCYMNQLDDPSNHDLVFRTYRIFMGGKPTILITETFPWALYQ